MYKVMQHGKVIKTNVNLKNLVEETLCGDVALIYNQLIYDWLETEPEDANILKQILRDMSQKRSEYAYWNDDTYYVVPLRWTIAAAQQCLNTFHTGMSIKKI